MCLFRIYLQVKSQLEKSLRSIKDLQRRLSLSEENVSSLYLRYAIETDLNHRLRKSQKLLREENEKIGRPFGMKMDDRGLMRVKQDGMAR